jgi:hypothetical protein
LSSQNGKFPCRVPQCKTCSVIDSAPTIWTTISIPCQAPFHMHLLRSYLLPISCSRCGMLYIGETGRPLRTRFGEHWRTVIGNDANQPVARYFSTGNHSVSDVKIRVLGPISGSNDNLKTQLKASYYWHYLHCSRLCLLH